MIDRNHESGVKVANFWAFADMLIYGHLRFLGADDAEADGIAHDLHNRLSTIDTVIPRGEVDSFYFSFATLICSAVTAEQKLFAAKYGHVRGRLLGDWPPTPIAFEHPFLRAVQQIVSKLEAEANSLPGRAGLH